MKKFIFKQERQQLNNQATTGGSNDSLQVSTNCHFWTIDFYVAINQNNPVGIFIDEIFHGVNLVNVSGSGSIIYWVGWTSYKSQTCDPNVYYTKRIKISNAAGFDVVNAATRPTLQEVVSLSITRGWFQKAN